MRPEGGLHVGFVLVLTGLLFPRWDVASDFGSHLGSSLFLLVLEGGCIRLRTGTCKLHRG